MKRVRFYQQAQPSFWTGFGQVIDLFGTEAQADIFRFRRSQADALASDWKRVGWAIRRALRKFQVMEQTRPNHVESLCHSTGRSEPR